MKNTVIFILKGGHVRIISTDDAFPIWKLRQLQILIRILTFYRIPFHQGNGISTDLDRQRTWNQTRRGGKKINWVT